MELFFELYDPSLIGIYNTGIKYVIKALFNKLMIIHNVQIIF